jgi:hypothetical protein
MPLTAAKKKQNNKQALPRRRSHGAGGLWVDELVDRMMEDKPSGYVGFRCTYKHDILKRTVGG